jgi:signal transduction histidine kinase
LRQGVYDYLVKPFQPDMLLTTTQRAAEKISLERERALMLSELAQAKEQAEQASRSKTEFLTRMGGELGQHFSTLVELSSAVAEQKLGPIGNEQYATFARGISTGCARMLHNMQSIGELGHLEAGTTPVSEADFALSDVVQYAVSRYQSEIARKQLVLEVSVDKEIPPVQSDARHFLSILDHLISNAVKFSPPGGRVSVSARMDGKSDLWLLVNDHGPGIPDNKINVALAPFGQIEQGDGQGQENDPFCAGLGLPLAMRLTRLLGGKLGIKSAVGAGTSARVFFPGEKVFEFAKMRKSVL